MVCLGLVFAIERPSLKRCQGLPYLTSQFEQTGRPAVQIFFPFPPRALLVIASLLALATALVFRQARKSSGWGYQMARTGPLNAEGSPGHHQNALPSRLSCVKVNQISEFRGFRNANREKDPNGEAVEGP